MKKLQVLAICMVILVSFVITSCGSGSSGSGTTANTIENASSSEATTAAPATPDELRILSYFTAEYNNYSKESQYTDWPVLKEIEKRTNTKITWEMYARD
ncbi:MAG: hypothetical protein FIA99_10550, partial [Ruminiclostridium sp.]|nr:hypothetical protein [Ruminiclostridium sp.]